MRIRSTSLLRLLGVSALPLEQESPWGCVRFLSGLLMPSPLGRGGDSVRCAVSSWPSRACDTGVLLGSRPQTRSPLVAPILLPQSAWSLSGRVSGDRALWQLCLPGISSFCSQRPAPAVVTPAFLAGPSPPPASGSASICGPGLKRRGTEECTVLGSEWLEAC